MARQTNRLLRNLSQNIRWLRNGMPVNMSLPNRKIRGISPFIVKKFWIIRFDRVDSFGSLRAMLPEVWPFVLGIAGLSKEMLSNSSLTVCIYVTQSSCRMFHTDVKRSSARRELSSMMKRLPRWIRPLTAS